MVGSSTPERFYPPTENMTLGQTPMPRRLRKGLRLCVAILCGLAGAFWVGLYFSPSANDTAVIFTGLAIVSIVLLAGIEFYHQAE